MRKINVVLLLLLLATNLVAIGQESKHKSLIQNTWMTGNEDSKKHFHFKAYSGNEDTLSNYVLHEFKSNETVFTTTHYSNAEKKLHNQKIALSDELFIEEEKWNLKENELTWYVRSAIFGKPAITEVTKKFKIISLEPEEMILLLIDTQKKEH